jgi:hypothetical protein
MPFDIETGRIELSANGDNGLIKRKGGAKVKIPSSVMAAKLMEEAGRTQDYEKMRKFNEDFPKIMEGDTLISGAKTLVQLHNNYNKGRDRPSEDWKASESKSMTLFPNSEAKVSGLEGWDRLDRGSNKRYHGEMFRTVEVTEGLFHCSYSRCEDGLLTPPAEIRFHGPGGQGLFDIQGDVLYCSPLGSSSVGEEGTVEFTNRRSKRSYIAKGGMQEIIVSGNVIYRKPVTKMDAFLQAMGMQAPTAAALAKMAPAMMPMGGAQKDVMKNAGKNMEQAVAGLEMFKKMTPEDIERMAKMGGVTLTPEQLKQIRELPAMVKQMEQEGVTEKMKKAAAIGRGFSAGIGEAGVERMAKMQAEDAPGNKKAMEANLTAILEGAAAPRNYAPLEAKFKVA